MQGTQVLFQEEDSRAAWQLSPTSQLLSSGACALQREKTLQQKPEQLGVAPLASAGESSKQQQRPNTAKIK